MNLHDCRDELRTIVDCIGAETVIPSSLEWNSVHNTAESDSLDNTASMEFPNLQGATVLNMQDR